MALEAKILGVAGGAAGRHGVARADWVGLISMARSRKIDRFMIGWGGEGSDALFTEVGSLCQRQVAGRAILGRRGVVVGGDLVAGEALVRGSCNYRHSGLPDFVVAHLASDRRVSRLVGDGLLVFGVIESEV